MLKKLTLILDTDDAEFRAEVPVIPRSAAPGALILRDHGMKKIQVIKIVRHYTGLGLKEAKELTESLPHEFEFEDLKRPEVIENPGKLRNFADDLAQVGAQVDVGGSRENEEILMTEIIGAFARACGVKVND